MEFEKLFRKSTAVAMTLALGLSVAACEEPGVPSYSTKQTAMPNGSTADTAAQSLPNDESTQADHDAYYGK